MKEFFESLFDAYKGRYKNKFIGTFLLVYVVWHWDKAIAIFFISEMSYGKFISLWGLDIYSFAYGIGYTFIISCVYLAVSPWLSFVVHVAQSKAVTQYKIQTLKNDRMVFEEKQAMESARQGALALEQKNVESEVAIEESKEKLQESNDKKKYLEIIYLFPEEKIRKMFNELEEGYISSEMHVSILYLNNKVNSIEYTFEFVQMERSRIAYAETINALFNYLKNNLVTEVTGYSLKDTSLVAAIKDTIISAYRNFYKEGKNID